MLSDSFAAKSASLESDVKIAIFLKIAALSFRVTFVVSMILHNESALYSL